MISIASYFIHQKSIYIFGAASSRIALKLIDQHRRIAIHALKTFAKVLRAICWVCLRRLT